MSCGRSPCGDLVIIVFANLDYLALVLINVVLGLRAAAEEGLEPTFSHEKPPWALRQHPTSSFFATYCFFIAGSFHSSLSLSLLGGGRRLLAAAIEALQRMATLLGYALRGGGLYLLENHG